VTVDVNVARQPSSFGSSHNLADICAIARKSHSGAGDTVNNRGISSYISGRE
jgi:hypothetical protein